MRDSCRDGDPREKEKRLSVYQIKSQIFTFFPEFISYPEWGNTGSQSGLRSGQHHFNRTLIEKFQADFD